MTLPVIKSALLVCVTFGTMQVQANDNMDITLNGISNSTQQVSDGQIVGHGRVSTQQAHSGYQVWLNAERNGDAPHRYILEGKNNRQHKLYVVIDQEGWRPDIKGGLGIIKQTRDVQAQFDIVANGNQNAPVDTYVIRVQCRYLEP
ncbi:AfaD family invasin [Edwardsiella tarda]